MRNLQRLRQWSLVLVLGLGLAACNEPGDATGVHGGEGWVTLNIALHGDGGTGAEPLSTGVLASQIGASYVLAVPAGTSVSPYPWAMPTPFDAAMMDTVTSSVQLTVPTGVSLQLVEYMFNDALTLNSVLSRISVPGGPNVSAPFTIAAGTTHTNIALPITPTSFSESLASSPLDPLLWNLGVGDGLIERKIVAGITGNTLQITASGRDNLLRGRLRAITSANNPIDIAAVARVEADVKVVSVSGTGAVARLAGFFYHSFALGETPGDATGDIAAILQLDGTNASYRVGKCLADDCSFATFQDIAPLTALAPVAVGATVHLAIRWDPVLGNFAFSVTPLLPTPGPAVATNVNTYALGYTATGQAPKPFKEVGTRTNTALGETGSITAQFDDVLFDGQTYDDFENTPSFINTAKWDVGTGGASIVSTTIGGVTAPKLRLTTSQAPSGDLNIDPNGTIAQVRSNRNQQLNSHRIAGTMLLPSPNPIVVTEIAGNSQVAGVRAVARLFYQSRGLRSAGSIGLNIIDMGIYQFGNGAPFPTLQGFVCLDPGCVTTAPGLIVSGTFSGTTSITGDTPYDFSLEYVGNKRFRGIFNGEAKVLDMSNQPAFNENDFIDSAVRVNARRAIDSGDLAKITADFYNLQVGQPGAPTFPALLAPLAPLYDDFSATDGATAIPILTAANWQEPKQFKRFVNTSTQQMEVDIVSQPGTNNGTSTRLPVRTTPTTIGLSSEVAFSSIITYPNAITTGVVFYGGVSADLYVDTSGNVLQARLQFGTDGQVTYDLQSCDAVSHSCAQVDSNQVVAGVPLTSTKNLALTWDKGLNKITFEATLGGGTNSVVIDTTLLPAANRFANDLPNGPDFRLESGSFRNLQLDTTVFIGPVFFDNVQMDNGSGPGSYETFVAGPIDIAKWKESDLTQIVSAGALNLAQTNGSFADLDLVSTPYRPAVAADFNVSSSSGDGRAMLVMVGYQSGGEIVIGAISINTTAVDGWVVHCSGNNCENLKTAQTVPIGVVTPGTTHTLYIQWDGGFFAYQMDSNPVVVIDPKPLLPITAAANGNGAILAFDLSAVGITNNGSVAATVDNVRSGVPRPVPLP